MTVIQSNNINNNHFLSQLFKYFQKVNLPLYLIEQCGTEDILTQELINHFKDQRNTQDFVSIIQNAKDNNKSHVTKSPSQGLIIQKFDNFNDLYHKDNDFRNFFLYKILVSGSISQRIFSFLYYKNTFDHEIHKEEILLVNDQATVFSFVNLNFIKQVQTQEQVLSNQSLINNERCKKNTIDSNLSIYYLNYDNENDLSNSFICIFCYNLNSINKLDQLPHILDVWKISDIISVQLDINSNQLFIQTRMFEVFSNFDINLQYLGQISTDFTQFITNIYNTQKQMFQSAKINNKQQLEASLKPNYKSGIINAFRCLDNELNIKEGWQTQESFLYYSQTSKLDQLQCLIFDKSLENIDKVYKLQLTIGSDYPFSPPQLKFDPPLFHPYINKKGEFELEMIKNWNPTYTIEKLLIHVKQLLCCEIKGVIQNYLAYLINKIDSENYSFYAQQQEVCLYMTQIQPLIYKDKGF